MDSNLNLCKWIIYMYIFPNGKKYIGKTSKSLQERQGNKWCKYVQCPALYNAYLKYGEENIVQQILFENYMTQERASRLEMICIALFKTNCQRYRNPEYGYNLTDGGDGTVGPRLSCQGDNHVGARRVYCIETRQYYGSILTASQEMGFPAWGIGACCRGIAYTTSHKDDEQYKTHWLFAEDVSDDNIQCVLQKRQMHHHERAVYAIELNQYFINSSEVQKQGLATSIDVRNCCRGDAISTGRYVKNREVIHWLWADEVTEYNIHIALARKCIASNARRVYCIESDMYFNTEKEASLYAGVTHIKHALNYIGHSGGRHPITGEPLHWLFAEQVSEERIRQEIEASQNLPNEIRSKISEHGKAVFSGENNPRALFTKDDVKDIIQRLLNGESSASIARDYRRPSCAVSGIKNHRSWKKLTEGIKFPNYEAKKGE